MGYTTSLLSFLLSLPGLGAAALLFAAYKVLAFVHLYAPPLPLAFFSSGDSVGVGIGAGDDALALVLTPPLARYLHASRGRSAWALVAGADDGCYADCGGGGGVGAELCFELAARGFNVVLYGRSAARLGAMRERLAGLYPEASFRVVVVADALVGANLSRNGVAGAGFAARVAASLGDVNLTVLALVNMDTVNEVVSGSPGEQARGDNGEAGGGGGAEIIEALRAGVSAPVVQLVAAVLPLLKRNKPALVIDVGPIRVVNSDGDGDHGAMTLPSKSKASSLALSLALGLAREQGVEVVSHRVGEMANAQGTGAPSLLSPAPRDVARAVLARVGCGKEVIVPHWPHALIQMAREVLPARVVDQGLARLKGIRWDGDSAVKKKIRMGMGGVTGENKSI
ncbi:hypothetical protein AAE478_006440 [Parahypoxylon ruwenzoriense]